MGRICQDGSIITVCFKLLLRSYPMSVEGDEACDLLCPEAKAGLFLPALSFITVRTEAQRVITQFQQ
jgi:hypothetical protein